MDVVILFVMLIVEKNKSASLSAWQHSHPIICKLSPNFDSPQIPHWSSGKTYVGAVHLCTCTSDIERRQADSRIISFHLFIVVFPTFIDMYRWFCSSWMLKVLRLLDLSHKSNQNQNQPPWPPLSTQMEGWDCRSDHLTSWLQLRLSHQCGIISVVSRTLFEYSSTYRASAL